MNKRRKVEKRESTTTVVMSYAIKRFNGKPLTAQVKRIPTPQVNVINETIPAQVEGYVQNVLYKKRKVTTASGVTFTTVSPGTVHVYEPKNDTINAYALAFRAGNKDKLYMKVGKEEKSGPHLKKKNFFTALTGVRPGDYVRLGPRANDKKNSNMRVFVGFSRTASKGGKQYTELPLDQLYHVNVDKFPDGRMYATQINTNDLSKCFPVIVKLTGGQEFTPGSLFKRGPCGLEPVLLGREDGETASHVTDLDDRDFDE